ncbi:recombinase family protein [Phenylobacterium kunshanense]|uniref:Recombinase family protein n=1 Tax=Phenylobacterium kunshanense TaxID=1445034 RepID=A0A328BB44_9CAUL|nr:recombinase family protein [Phenylobacterium kunshanense]RAK63681.1 recombinase family protein [Phenylobacterium kunshanense]
MLRIGYVRLRDATAHEDTATLKAAGCQVVRAEEPGRDGETLSSILDFIGAGDQLVVTRLDRLALNGRGLLDALDRLDARGASLHVLAPELSSDGAAGSALRAVLEAVADLEPAGVRRRRPTAATHEIFALQRAGVGPVEIARRLGVSRMTVWRKLKALENAEA